MSADGIKSLKNNPAYKELRTIDILLGPEVFHAQLN